MIRRIDPSEFPGDPPEDARPPEPPPEPKHRTTKDGLNGRIERIRKLAAEGRLDPGNLPAFPGEAAPPARGTEKPSGRRNTPVGAAGPR